MVGLTDEKTSGRQYQLPWFWRPNGEFTASLDKIASWYNELPPPNHWHDADQGQENPTIQNAWLEWLGKHGPNPWDWMKQVKMLAPWDQITQ
jgi:hypothetical protein